MCGAYQEHPATLFPPQAGPLVAQRGSADVPEQHCTLAYPSPAAGSSCQPAGGACGTFAAQRYMAALDTRLLGRLLLTAAATASTQVVVQENVAKLPDGLVFVADKQYGGKGEGWCACRSTEMAAPAAAGLAAPAAPATIAASPQRTLPGNALCLARPSCGAGRDGNRWESPDGCLMFSAATRLAIPGQRLPFVQYVVSLAVVQAVQAEAARRLQARIRRRPAACTPLAPGLAALAARSAGVLRLPPAWPLPPAVAPTPPPPLPPPCCRRVAPSTCASSGLTTCMRAG